MKISVMIIFIVLVGGLFYIFGTGVKELNTQYPEHQLNTSAWDSKYDASIKINNSIGKLTEKFNVITDEKQGFFTKIGAGITAIPYAIILVPATVLDAITTGGSMITGFFITLQLPSKIIFIGILVLTIFGIFKLVEFFQRTRA